MPVRDILTPMEHRVILAVFFGLAIQPLSAQTACLGLPPIKPASLFCPTAAPICVPNANSVGGRWVWGCPTNAATAPTSSPTDIPNAMVLPKFDTPTDAAIKAQQLRRLQLQNQTIEEQLKNSQSSSATNAGTTKSGPPSLLTWGSINGGVWKVLTVAERTAYLGALSSASAKAREATKQFGNYKPPAVTLAQILDGLDGFYGDSLNLLIPIPEALQIISMKREGAPQSDIDLATTMERKFANEAPERSQP